MIESIPEWQKFEEEVLDINNEKLKGALGGKDPRTDIESLFSDNDGFKNFKPVIFQNDGEEIPEDEEEEDQDSDDDLPEDDCKELDEEDIEKYFEDVVTGADEEDDMEIPDFSQTQKSGPGISEISANRYEDIELEDDKDLLGEAEFEGEDRDLDLEQDNLGWMIDHIGNQNDDQQLIEDMHGVAYEIISGVKSGENCLGKEFQDNDDLGAKRRKNKQRRNKQRAQKSNILDRLDDDDFMIGQDIILEDLQIESPEVDKKPDADSAETPEIFPNQNTGSDSDSEEEVQFHDNTYWQTPIYLDPKDIIY